MIEVVSLVVKHRMDQADEYASAYETVYRHMDLQLNARPLVRRRYVRLAFLRAKSTPYGTPLLLTSHFLQHMEPVSNFLASVSSHYSINWATQWSDKKTNHLDKKWIQMTLSRDGTKTK